MHTSYRSVGLTLQHVAYATSCRVIAWVHTRKWFANSFCTVRVADSGGQMYCHLNLRGGGYIAGGSVLQTYVVVFSAFTSALQHTMQAGGTVSFSATVQVPKLLQLVSSKHVLSSSCRSHVSCLIAFVHKKVTNGMLSDAYRYVNFTQTNLVAYAVFDTPFCN